MPTSVAPWHPRTDVTAAAIEDIRRLFGFNIRIDVYCDGPHPKSTETDRCAYSGYKSGLRLIDNVRVVELEDWKGLVGLHRAFLSDFVYPLVLNVQHDWRFPRPERIDIEGLCQTMLEHPEVQVVRFHKRRLPQKPIYVDRQYFEVRSFPVPLISTDGWGDSPHLARADHYHNFVAAHLATHCGQDGRYGVEGPVTRAYKSDIARMGFEEAQRRWGSYIYGRFNDPAFIVHNGSAARSWRKHRGIVQ